MQRIVREYEERCEQREIALGGRHSFGETLPVPGIGIEWGIFAGVSIPIALTEPIGAPKPTPGECTCRPPCIQPIPIFEANEATNMQLTPTEKAICAQTGVTEEQFVAAKAKRSPFPDAARADIRDDGKTRGMPMRPAHDVDGEDLRGCTLENLASRRDAIVREIQRRTGVNKVVRFAK